MVIRGMRRLGVSGSSKATGKIPQDLKQSHAHFAKIDLDQNGVPDEAAAWSRKTAMSRRTKKHRNANINLEKKMAKAKSGKARGESVYRITELVGTSSVSWEDAAKRAVETAAGSLRDLRVADIVKLDVKVDGGKVVAYRARVSLSFKYEG